MQAGHVDAFLASTFEVLDRQAAARPERGSPVLRSGETSSTREVTVLVTVQGDLAGIIFYSMSLATAEKLSAVVAQRPEDGLGPLDDETLLAMARLSLDAGVEHLTRQGCTCTVGDFMVVRGFGAPLTAVSPVLMVPVYSSYGDIDIGVSLQPPDQIPSGTRLVLVDTPAAPDDEAEETSAA
jgi:CheY-specific phosphatase CheX